MARKYIPTEIDNLQSEVTAVNTINENLADIADQFDNTLSRDGTGPNAMRSVLDMNSNRIINLPTPTAPTDVVRLMDLPDTGGGGGGGGDGDGGIGNGIIGRLYWDLNSDGLPRLRIIPSLTLQDPGVGDTVNPGGFKRSNLMFWNTQVGGASGSTIWINEAVSDLPDPSVVTAKHSNFLVGLFAYNQVTEGTGITDAGQEVIDITITDGGSGYSTPPNVTITSNDSGSGAKAKAVLTDGVVTSIIIQQGGEGYFVNPSVVFSGGGGGGATGTSVLGGNDSHPQEVGPLTVRVVTASGNTTGKSEGIVCSALHEDDTADGKLVAGQFITSPYGADPGRGQHVEDADGDESTTDGYACYILRLNAAGPTRISQGICMKTGKKFAVQEGFAIVPMYTGYGVDGPAIYAGDRDPTYTEGVDDPRAGRSFCHWDTAALNGWGWLGLGTDDPDYHIDIQTVHPSETIDITTQNLDNADASLIATNRSITRHRYFGLNDFETNMEMARMTVSVVDPSKNHEDSAFIFSTVTDHSFSTAFKIGAGAWAGGGGDPGIGALGCDSFKVNTVIGYDTSGKLIGSVATTAKAAINTAADWAAGKAALLAMFA